MSFWDRVRAWFKGETTPRRKAPSASTGEPDRAATKDLEAFLTSRTGVEGYMEPKTAIYSTTLLLVAADGEYLRRPIKDRATAQALCDKHNVPLYDAGIVGYPKRMRDYDQGVRRETVSLEELPPWPGEDAAGEDTPGADAPDDATDDTPDDDEGPGPAPAGA